MPDKKEYIGSNRLSQILTYIKEKFDGVDTNLSTKVDKVNGKALSTNDFTDAFKTKLEGVATGAQVNVQSDWDVTDTNSDAFILHKPNIPAAQVNSDWNASSGVAQILNKPTIPTVNNGTLTIQRNGTNVQTFSANQSSNATANITVPTKVSELTNDSGYTTNIGTVTQVKVGTTAYDPSSGVVSLPAYPDISTKVSKSGDTMSGNLTFSGSAGIQYTGTKATYGMIKFKDNTSDTYGNGIIIGGGGLTVIGAGESADTVAAQFSAGDENMHVAADSNVYIYSNVNNGYSSRYTFTFGTDGKLTIPGIANCSYLQTDTNVTYGRNGFQYFNQSTSTTSGAKANANPSSGWYHIIRMNHSNSAGYFVDLAFALNHAASPAYRMISNGSEQGWRTFIDSSNIGSQSVNYATSAGTATSATKATQDGSGNTITSTYLKLSGGTLSGTLKVGNPANTSTFPTVGIHIHDTRGVAHTPGSITEKAVNFFFSNNTMPNTDWWAGMHVHGWSSTYVAWELVGPATTGDKREIPLYVRTSNGTSAWGSWRKIYDTSNKPSKSDVGLGNVDNTADANKSVKSATKATQDGSGNTITTTYSTKSETTIYKGILSSLGSGTPANQTQSYWENVNNIPLQSVQVGYNTSGDEYTILFSKGSSANYGSVLKYGYPSTYMYILRRKGGSWLSTDWEKISAGYADSAGSATTAGNVTGTVAVANGGTGATTAANARTNLGLGTAATYTAATSATGGTVVLRDSSGYIYCVHVNQSSSDQASSYGTNSMLVYCNSDGWFRKAGGFGARYSVTSTWGVGRCASSSYSSYNNYLHCWDPSQAVIRSEVSGVNMTIQVNGGTLYLYSNQTYSWNGAWRPIYASQFSVQSSIQIKKNVKDMEEEEANKLFQLRPVKYDYINEANGTNCYGLIAEEVQDIGVNYPVSIMKDPETEKEIPSLDYSKFVPYLIKVVQMQQEEINELKQKVS